MLPGHRKEIGLALVWFPRAWVWAPTKASQTSGRIFLRRIAFNLNETTSDEGFESSGCRTGSRELRVSLQLP